MVTFREELRHFRSSDAAGADQERILNSEELVFVESARDAFVVAVNAAEDVSGYITNTELMRSQKRSIIEIIDSWFLYRFRIDEQRKMVEEITSSLGSKRMVLRDFDDVMAFDFLLDSGVYSSPEMIEHYAQTGELLELTELFRKDDGVFLRGFDKYGNLVSRSPRVRTRRIYFYDLQMMQEHVNEGLDRDDVMLPPLEVRIEFSGFWEEVFEEEKEDSSVVPVDYYRASSDEAFNAKFLRDQKKSR